jgi:hypothetical protein
VYLSQYRNLGKSEEAKEVFTKSYPIYLKVFDRFVDRPPGPC